MSMERDLDFYFNIATLGLKSGFFDSLNIDRTRTIPIHPYFGVMATYDEPVFNQREVIKYRKVHQKFHALNTQQRRQLSALFDAQYRYPPEILAMFGKKSGLSLFSSQVKTLQELIQVFTKRDKTKQKAIQAEVDKMYQELKEAWSKK